MSGTKSKAPGFLEPHHLEAARRIATLFERAQLSQRVTMRYAPVPVSARKAGASGEMSDMAADAARRWR